MNSYFIQDNLPFVLFIGAAVQILALYLIIAFATKADKRAKYEWVQMELLAKIARAQGVPEEEIRETLQSVGLLAKQ